MNSGYVQVTINSEDGNLASITTDRDTFYAINSGKPIYLTINTPEAMAVCLSLPLPYSQIANQSSPELRLSRYGYLVDAVFINKSGRTFAQDRGELVAGIDYVNNEYFVALIPFSS